MILILDNYDSFVFNLDQALAGLGCATHVVRNDALTAAEAVALAPDAVVLSPGPGRPERAGILLELLDALPAETPVLGVCLGHQAIVVSEGGELVVDDAPQHGKTSAVHHDGSALFDRMPTPITAGRYHSLYARRDAIPDALSVSAWTEDGKVMAVRHRTKPRFGIQFHPESILTPRGGDLLARFVSLSGIPLTGDTRTGGALGGSVR